MGHQLWSCICVKKHNNNMVPTTPAPLKYELQSTSSQLSMFPSRLCECCVVWLKGEALTNLEFCKSRPTSQKGPDLCHCHLTGMLSLRAGRRLADPLQVRTHLPEKSSAQRWVEMRQGELNTVTNAWDPHSWVERRLLQHRWVFSFLSMFQNEEEEMMKPS